MFIPKTEEIAINTPLSIPVPITPVSTTTADNILDYIKATHVSPSLSVDAALQQARALTKSPISKLVVVGTKNKKIGFDFGPKKEKIKVTEK